MKPYVLTAVLCLFACSATAAVREDLLFHATFDSTLVARNHAGTPIQPSASPAAPEFAAGRPNAGSALKTGGPGSYVAYPTAGTINLDAGTVAMWIRPDGWSTGIQPSESDTFLRHFFNLSELPDATNPNPGYVSLYKSGGGSVTWLAFQNSPVMKGYWTTPGLTADSQPYYWSDGVWAHVVATWSGNVISLYVNGTYRGSAHTPPPHMLKSKYPTFSIGGANGSGRNDTLIDDVMLFREPFTPGEAVALFNDQTIVSPRPAPKLVIDATGTFPSLPGNPAGARLSMVGRRPSEATGITIHYTIKRKSDQGIAASGTILSGGVHKTYSLGQSLADGSYLLHAHAGDTASAATPAEFAVRPPPAWMNNAYGNDAGVPKGFDPVLTTTTGAFVRGRSYGWSQNGLPAQITAAGKPLLSRPMRLTGVVNGMPYTLQTSAWAWEDREDRRAAFHANGTLGPLGVTIEGTIEFDGFVWTTISIAGSHSRVSNLALEIPMNASTATLMAGRRVGTTGDLMASGPVRTVSGFLPTSPLMWMGNEDVGLQWSTNDVTDWKLSDTAAAVKITAGASEVVTRLTFVDHEVKIDGDTLDYNIGLQATPVKSYGGDVREWELNLNRIGTPHARRSWWLHEDLWNAVNAYPERGPYGYVYEGPDMRSRLSAANAAGLHPTLYNHLHALWTGDEVWQSQGLEWRGKFTGSGTTYSAGVELSHENAQVRDYILFMHRNLFNLYPSLKDQITGFYIDVAQATWDRDANPLNDDPAATIFSLLGTRELQRRLYTEIKQQSPNLKVINHQSGDPIMSQLAFSDAMLTGEHLGHQQLVTDFGYTKLLPLEAVRAEYSGRNLGVPMIFLPQFEQAAGISNNGGAMTRMLSAEGIAPTEHLVGLMWVHDVILLNFYMHRDPIPQAGRTKAAFGWDAATQFIPYWKNVAAYVDVYPTPPAGFVVSAFLRPGRAMFVAHNNTPNAVSVLMKPNWGAIGVTAQRLVDAYREQAQPAPPAGTSFFPASLNGYSRVDIPAWSFKAIVVRDN